MARRKLKKAQQKMLMLLLLLLGVGTLVYPDVANWLNERQQQELIQVYNEMLALMHEEEIRYERHRAQVFNEGLTGIHVIDPFVPGSGSVRSAEYYSILNFDGIMGTIRIPAIDVNLPIRHGTSDEVLAIGTGHMENTPFPIGGYGNHSIITGHTGMINMTLFNDLQRLEVGQLFFVEVLGETIAYQVDRRDIVFPHEIEILVSYEDQDLITLVTCTPYGVNSHRLLVRGIRVAYSPGMEDNIEVIVTPLNLRVLIVIGFSLLFAGMMWFYWKKKQEMIENTKFEKEFDQVYADWQKMNGHD